MLKSNHFLWTLGISPWIFYLLKLDLELIIILSISTAFLSSLPDIDQKIVKWFKKLNYHTFFLTYPIYLIVKLIFKHRTITHSLFIPIGLLYLNYTKISNEYIFYSILSLSIALILHVFEDSLTIAGVKAFWPIPYNLRFAKYKTANKAHKQILTIYGFIILSSFPIYWLFF